MKFPHTKWFLSLLFCISISLLYSQEYPAALSIQDRAEPDTSSQQQSSGFEIYKLKSSQKITIFINQKVRVNCYQSTGFMKVKNASVARIEDHRIMFSPSNSLYQETSFADSTLHYVELFSAGSLFRGIILNAVLVITSVAILVPVLIIDGFSHSNSGDWLGNTIGNLPWNNFHRHIHIINNRGEKKWGIRILYPQKIVNSSAFKG